MTLALLILFFIAAISAALTIWISAIVALPSIRNLRQNLDEVPEERPIHMATLDTRRIIEEDTAEPRRQRVSTRRTLPAASRKRRLQHYPHHTTAA